ncbi:decaprenyl-phosphate phosphoribosyltransferase [Achromobacter sp. GG226]|uniref:decaprenyl-phosphate phosphoribosyltransferase n=1 Tax=Verticiella alkaliphila TaxID=2779529 RepID=UPI001C0B85C6|nr:decaprenyl-phosphate phosphoribosyltransferase [Verticiella sp. GG226]MBU4611147.1 decaprenyl-phosphate phosphoribosyltransferase [Verticiella sp. GG226]
MSDPPSPAPAPLARVPALFALLRPRQWIKNGFVLAPLLFSGEFLDRSAIGPAVLAALLFCLGASAVYIVNDWRDIARDQLHPTKRFTRPLASGAITKSAAGLILLFLYALLTAAAWVLPGVVATIGVYLLVNIAYSFGLKNVPVVDIFLIASGFVLRVYAGALALALPVSEWMFVTTLCLALYLAAVKRRQELARAGTEGREVLGRYSIRLIDRYAETAATGTLVFYSLFVMASRPELIITIPLVLFGLFRYWYVVETLGGGESPTDALLADVPLIAVIGLWVAACLWALWPA